MIAKIFRAVSSTIISIALIAILFSAWTTYVIISQPSKANEINKVLGDIYQNQVSFTFNIIDLTKILIRAEIIVTEDSTKQDQNLFDVSVSSEDSPQQNEDLISKNIQSSKVDEFSNSIEEEESSFKTTLEENEEVKGLDHGQIEIPLNENFNEENSL